jgi:hypothetical protein
MIDPADAGRGLTELDRREPVDPSVLGGKRDDVISNLIGGDGVPKSIRVCVVEEE